MKQFLSLLLLTPVVTRAQAPVITSIIPRANAHAAARTSPVTVNFNQSLTAASAGALKVFSSQRGGLRTSGATPATVNANTLSFIPSAFPFMPGETVQYTVTNAAASSNGALAQARVGQFTTAVGGTGTGNFSGGSDPAVANRPQGVALGDVDSDGDLDLLTANYSNGGPGTVSIRLNNGTGIFSGSQDVAVGFGPESVAVGDVDSDGDLDLLTANYMGNSVSVRLNNGNGIFSGSQNVLTGARYPTGLAVGDMDADGDLDLLAVNVFGTVSVRLNNGSGVFSGTQSVAVGDGAYDVVIGDVDGDGDVDLLTPSYGSGGAGAVSIRLNDGSGTFTGSQQVAVGNRPQSIAVGDIDNDGDLDLLAANSGGTTVSVRLNNGLGAFSGSQEVAVGNISPSSMVVGDVDADGDLDLLTATASNSSGTVSIRLNNGSGTFTGGSDLAALGNFYTSMAMGDVDSDGDLDLLVTNDINSTVNVRLNGSTRLATTPRHSAGPITLYPNPAHGSATLTGLSPHAPIMLLDVLGRVLLTTTADATGTACLKLSASLPAGMYLVRSGKQVCHLAVE